MDATCFGQLSDQQLTDEVFRLAASERRATAELIASLGEFDRRRLFVPAGFSSMFTYCTNHLGLGEGASYRRIEAARLCRRFPAALGLLADGAVTLTTLALLAPHLTDANHLDVLTRAIRKSKRDVEVLVATLSPQPDVPTTLRRLPQRRSGSVSAAGLDLAPALPEPSPCRVLPLRPAHRPVVAPLTPERFKLQITMSRETHDTLREVQNLIRHSVPNGDPAIIVGRALTLLRDHLLRQKMARTARPRSSKAERRRQSPETPQSRHIPSEVKRLVSARDGERCAFIGRDGRCTERSFLEFHHVRPFAVGGTADARNIELRCRVHNGHEAEVFFGRRATPG